jgi:hypothetical protein
MSAFFIVLPIAKRCLTGSNDWAFIQLIWTMFQGSFGNFCLNLGQKALANTQNLFPHERRDDEIIGKHGEKPGGMP